MNIAQLIFSLVKCNTHRHTVSPNSFRSKNRYIYIPLVSKNKNHLHRNVAFSLHDLLHFFYKIKFNLIKAEKYSKSVLWIDKKLHDAKAVWLLFSIYLNIETLRVFLRTGVLHWKIQKFQCLKKDYILIY